MKKLLLKRILPFLMAMVMLASFCLPVGAFTIGSSGQDDEGEAYYTIEWDNGILQVVLNPQKVYDALKDGDFTKEELKQFIPAEVLETLEGKPTAEDLLALASEYLSKEDVKALFDILPKEILTEHFLNVGFLESLITLDEVISVISIDEILAAVEDEAKFNSDLNEMLTPYLDLLMTDKVIRNLMENQAFLETILADTIDSILANEEQRQIVMDALPELITDDVINALLGNEAYKDALVQMVIHNDAVLHKIQDDPETIHRLAEYLDNHRHIAEDLMNDPLIIEDLQHHPDWLINETVVEYMFTHNKLTPTVLHKVFGDDVINDMVAGENGEYEIVDVLMHSNALIDSVISSPAFAGIASKLMTDDLFKLALSDIELTDYITLNQDFANRFGITLQSLLDKDYIELDQNFLAEFGITLTDLIDKGYVELDEEFAAEFGITAESLIDKGYVTLDETFADKFGITADQLLEDGYVTLDATFAAEFGITPESLIDNDLLILDEAFAAAFGITADNLVSKGYVNPYDVFAAGLMNPSFSDLIAHGLVDVDGVLADNEYNITVERVLSSNAITLRTHEIISTYGISVADVFAADLVDVDGILADVDYGITPAAVFTANLVDINDILNDTDYDISIGAVIAEGFVDVDAILADDDYDISFASVIEKDLVDVVAIMNDPDYNITLERLGLSNTQLQEIAHTMLANPQTKTELMDAFTQKVKDGAIQPSEFIDCIDFRAIALQDNGIDLVGMIEDLLKEDENAEEHLYTLFNGNGVDFDGISLTDDDLHAIMAEMGHAECMAVLEEHFHEIVEDLGGPNVILNHFPDKMELVDALFGTPELPGFMALVAPDPVTGVALVSYDEIAIALGSVVVPNGSDDAKKNAGFGVLVDLLDPSLLASKLSSLLLEYVSFNQIVEAMGGFDQVLSWYDNELLMSIVQDIGTDRLMQFAKENGLLKTDILVQVAKDVMNKILEDKDRLKAFIANCKDSLIQIVLEEIDSLQINDTQFYKNGRFELQPLVYAILAAIPDVKTFCDMEEGDAILSFVFKATYHSGDAPSILGVEVRFDGDFTELQQLAAFHEDLFRFDVNEDLDILTASVLPKQVSTLYKKVLESDRLPDALRAKLLQLPTLSLSDLADELEAFTEEEIETLADIAHEKLIEILPEVIEKGENIINRVPDSVMDKITDAADKVIDAADKLAAKLPEGAIDRVTAILTKLSTPEGMDEALEKAANGLRKIPATALNFSIEQLYERDGHFYIDQKNFDFDPMEHTDLISKLPDRFQNLAESILSKIPNGMVDLSLSGSFTASLTVTGTYRLTLVDAEQNETVFFLPAGIDLSILDGVDGLDLSTFGENLPALMPAHDTVVYTPLQPDEAELVFIYHEPVSPFRAIEFDRIRYTWGDTTLSVTPKMPPEFRGFVADMPDYLAEMNIETTREIHVYYSETQYNLTFNHFNGTNTVIPFGVTSEIVIDENGITLDGHALPALLAATDEYSYVWKQGDVTYVSTEAFAEAMAEILADEHATLGDITLTESRVAKEYKLTFQTAEGVTYDEVTYTVETDPAELSARIPNAPAHPTAGYYFKWTLVEENGAAVEPATDWSKETFLASFRAGALTNLTVKAAEGVSEYTYTFVYLPENNRPNVTVTYTIETGADEFAAMVPAATEKHGYTYYWTLSGTPWSAGFFQAHNPDTLGNYTIHETGDIDTYVITLTLLDGSEVQVPYTVLSDINTIKAHFTLPEATAAYTYKWQKFVEAPAVYGGRMLLANGPDGEWVDWDPNTFSFDDLDHLVLKQVAVPVQYSFTIHKLNGSTVEIPYTTETARQTLIDALMAELPANTNGYTYAWEIKNGDSWQAWNVSAVDPTNVSFLANYEIRVAQTANVFTITFDMAKGNDILVNYTVETLMADFALPNHSVSRAYNYNAWLKGADAWTLATLYGADGVLSEDELASYTVTETGDLIPYTLTFNSIGGATTTVTYNFETAYAAFNVPALGTPANPASHERYWFASGSDWTLETLYGEDRVLSEDELASYTVTEQERLRIFTVTFEMANGNIVYVQYNVNGLLANNSIPTITPDSNRYTYHWERDGQAWLPADFDVSELADYTVREIKVAVDYTLVFVLLNGNTVTVVYNADNTPNEVKDMIPDLQEDSENVYAYDWYYQAANGKMEKWKETTFRGNSLTDAMLFNRTFSECKRVHDQNTLTFLRKDGSVIEKYYYDKQFFYTRDDSDVDTPVPVGQDGKQILPAAPELYGYTFDDWYFSNRWTGEKFDPDTFRDKLVPSDWGGRRTSALQVKATYIAVPYTLTFVRLDGTSTVVTYTVETDKNTLSIPQLPVSNKAYNYYWTAENGSRWTLEHSFQPQTALGNYVITENQELLEYVVTFLRADGSVKHVRLTFEVTRSQFEADMPVLVNNAAFERSWLYNGSEWTIDSLYTNGENITVNMLDNYRIEEKEIAYAFMLTFKDLEGNLITEVIYNGHGPLFGQIPELPSSEDGYAYSWWNVTEDTAWPGFDPLACKNLELRLTREPIVYNLTFKIEGQPDVHATYTVLDHSFTVPTVAPRAGYEHIWYYLDGETQRIWTKEGLTVGDLVLYSDFVPLKYTVVFTAEDGTEYIFVMTVENKSHPSVPPKAGHIGTWYVQLGNEPADTDPKWSDYKLASGAQNVKVYVKYSPLPYSIDFMIDGVFFSSGSFVLGGEWAPPTPPAKPGYSAEWYIQSGNDMIKWSEYSLESGASKLIAHLVYTPIEYTAKFYADGALVGSTTFTVEDSKLSKIPAIPQKSGFTAVWSEYKIGPNDLEIHAIYTAIEVPPTAHPLEGKAFLLFIDSFVGGLYDGDPDGLHWIWWLIIILLIILIILTLILILTKRKKKETPPEEPEEEPIPVVDPTPEEEPVPEIEEILETVDVETADALMTDVTAMAVLETVGGAKASGLKSIINISKINESYEAHDTVDLESLKSKKMVPAKTQRLKVLGDGHLDKPLTVVADSFSVQAIKMITLTGGTAVQKKSEK